MSSTQEIITLPDKQMIGSGDSVKDWSNLVTYHSTSRTHIVGSTETTDGYSMGAVSYTHLTLPTMCVV